MSIEQLIAKAEQLNVSPMILELLTAAHEIGKTDGVRDVLADLEHEDMTDAAEFVTANYPL